MFLSLYDANFVETQKSAELSSHFLCNWLHFLLHVNFRSSDSSQYVSERQAINESITEPSFNQRFVIQLNG